MRLHCQDHDQVKADFMGAIPARLLSQEGKDHRPQSSNPATKQLGAKISTTVLHGGKQFGNGVVSVISMISKEPSVSVGLCSQLAAETPPLIGEEMCMHAGERLRQVQHCLATFITFLPRNGHNASLFQWQT